MTDHPDWLQLTERASELEIAAGCFGHDGYGCGIPDLSSFAEFAAVVLKSTSLRPMPGNPEPTFFDLGHGNYWNCVGLRNPGIEKVVSFLPDLPNLRLSLYAENEGEWRELIETANELPVRSLELNLSCPAFETPTTGDLDRVVATARKPVWLKVSPRNRVEDLPEGIAGVICGNTMRFDVGGLSGEVCRPYNLKLTETYSRLTSVIGCGGIATVDDLDAYLEAGAVRGQVGSLFRVMTERPPMAAQEDVRVYVLRNPDEVKSECSRPTKESPPG